MDSQDVCARCCELLELSEARFNHVFWGMAQEMPCAQSMATKIPPSPRPQRGDAADFCAMLTFSQDAGGAPIPHLADASTSLPIPQVLPQPTTPTLPQPSKRALPTTPTMT